MTFFNLIIKGANAITSPLRAPRLQVDPCFGATGQGV